jgi:hypothetical protein
VAAGLVDAEWSGAVPKRDVQKKIDDAVGALLAEKGGGRLDQRLINFILYFLLELPAFRWLRTQRVSFYNEQIAKITHIYRLYLLGEHVDAGGKRVFYQIDRPTAAKQIEDVIHLVLAYHALDEQAVAPLSRVAMRVLLGTVASLLSAIGFASAFILSFAQAEWELGLIVALIAALPMVAYVVWLVADTLSRDRLIARIKKEFRSE